MIKKRDKKKKKAKVAFKKKSLIVFFIILAVVILTFFVFSRQQYEEGCLSLTFDDSCESHYTIVYPMLKERNFSATFFVMANRTSFERELMTPEQIKEISDDGFEIGSHTLTHPHLDEIKDETEIEREISESKKILEKEYNITVDTLALPYFGYNDKVLEIARKYYISVRSMANKKDSFFLDRWGLQNDTEVEDICSYIRLTKEKKLWTIFVLHDIKDNPRIWDTSTNDFKAILDCINDSGIVVDSIRGCRNRRIE